MAFEDFKTKTQRSKEAKLPSSLSAPLPIRASASNPDEAVLAETVWRGWQIVARGQLANGEMVAFRKDGLGATQPLRSPFVTIAVHEALACFDPLSPFYRPGCGELLPGPAGRRFRQEVGQLRRRCRAYLAWQEEPAGWWRFFGRGSGMDPDVNTTVGAALALIERQSSHWPAGAHGHSVAVGRFRAADGRYHTVLKPGWGGYAWLDARGWPVAGFDRVVNADVLRYLRLAGAAPAELAELAAFVAAEAAGDGWLGGTPIYPNPLSFPFAAGRAWRQAGLPGLEELAAALLPGLLARQAADGAFGGPLSTALAVATLLELELAGPELAAGCRALTWALRGEPSALYEDFVVHGFGSPALTAALAIHCLARATATGANA
jgi:hypothetical protein